MKAKCKPTLKVGQRVMFTCEGTIAELTPFSSGRGHMFQVEIGGATVPCYREELRPLTKRESAQ